MRAGKGSAAAALLLGLAALAGCAGNGGSPGGVPAERPQRVVGFACPDMQIQLGAQSFTVYDGATQSPSRIRYQASIREISRECFSVGGNLSINFSVGGRIVAGPRGTGGAASAVLDVSVLLDNAEVVFRRAYTVAANVGAPPFGGDFTMGDTVTLPFPAEGHTLRVVVGFDQ